MEKRQTNHSNYYLDASRLNDRKKQLIDVTQEAPEILQQLLKTYDDFWNSLEPEDTVICHLQNSWSKLNSSMCHGLVQGASPWNTKSQRNKKRQWHLGCGGNSEWALSFRIKSLFT